MSQTRSEILILGSIQDGGYPHVGCRKECCKDAWRDPSLRRYIASIVIVDHICKKYWLIDITPDFKEQLNLIFKTYSEDYSLSGIFLTHAHVGHYTGLFKLGLEIMNTKCIPVYAMPRLNEFLHDNSSTEFLFRSNNIISYKLNKNEQISLSDDMNISPFLVPHRNELSETVGYKIISRSRSVIYIPDIDSWDLWEKNILDIIKDNDLLFIDGTFYDKNELKTRNIEKVTHPSITESIKIFKDLSNNDKNKIYFTHLNHTNILLRENSKEYKEFLEENYHILRDGEIFSL